MSLIRNNQHISKEIIFTILITTILIFFCGPIQLENMLVLTINVKLIGIMLMLVFLCMDIALIISHHGIIRWNSISTLLVIRSLYYSFAVLIRGDNDNMANYLACLLVPLVYIFFSNVQISKELFFLWMKILWWIIGIQTLVVTISLIVNKVPMYMLKSRIQIPVGGSNGISTYILMLFPIIYKLESREIKRLLYLASAIILVLLTRSTSGFICFTGIMLVILFQEKKYRILKIMISICVGLVMIYLVAYFSSEYLQRLVSAFQSILSMNSDSFEGVLNGRMPLWKQCYELWRSNPIIGVGFTYRQKTTGNLMAHNWILEALVSGGIVGSTFLIVAFVIIGRKIIKLHQASSYVFLYSLVVVLIQGLLEPSVGTMRFDVILWCILGFATKRRNMTL